MIKLFTLLSLLVFAACTYEIQPDPIYRETEVRNERPRAAGESFDPQESNPELRHIFLAVDKTAERRVGNVERNADFILRFWYEKKSILSDEYDIQWQSPADLNPNIDYGDYGQPVITENERQFISAYLKSKGYVGDESIDNIWRDFNGTVYVATTDNETGRWRQYRLSGIGNEWQFIDVFFVEE